jgi:hypothetical protein
MFLTEDDKTNKGKPLFDTFALKKTSWKTKIFYGSGLVDFNNNSKQFNPSGGFYKRRVSTC